MQAPRHEEIEGMMAVMTAAFPPDFGEAWSRRQLTDALAIGNCHHAIAMRGAPASPPALAVPATLGAAPDTGDEAAVPAGFRLSRTGVGEEELLLIAVAPAFRRRGIGLALLRGLAVDARVRGAARLILEMRRGNPAERLYRDFGFVVIGERPHYYRRNDGTRIDAITFACPI